MLDRLVSNRRVAVLAGLLLVLVPTLFSLYPEWADWGPGVRTLVLALWIVAALFVVLATTRQSERVEDLLEGPEARRDRQRQVAGARLIRALLRPEETGLPPAYEFRLFLPDPGSGCGGARAQRAWQGPIRVEQDR